MSKILDDQITPAYGTDRVSSGKSMEQIKGIVEALLFTAGEPVSINRLADTIQADIAQIEDAGLQLQLDYSGDSRGLRVIRINNAFQMVTDSAMFDYICQLAEIEKRQQLSQAAYEVLSIVAYKQPVIRAVIEKIRGVGSDSSIAKLMERGLIYESGRLDIPGRPITYSTTDEFLRCMGYSSLADLPPFPDTEEDTGEQMSLSDEMFSDVQLEQPTELPKLD
ncbi:MAG: SMC-Scp complex subunit ScpB [Clostridia bacterium]|nr:SMC-Scp complex subunit ScpB [Clostridia bacterium]